ncbi:hypothetical protein [Chryseobacterium joostei]|uniref:hypothetical protein n=1 Tax=Chryseobacterium joostei TaxID=112234 RepID=UPI0023F1AAD4|nr:hypothetical protein [Chryseobacterium joostei]
MKKNRSLPKFLIALVLFIPAYGFSQTYLDVEKYKSKIGAPINNILKNFKQKKIEQESFGISIKSVHINKYYYLSFLETEDNDKVGSINFYSKIKLDKQYTSKNWYDIVKYYSDKLKLIEINLVVRGKLNKFNEYNEAIKFLQSQNTDDLDVYMASFNTDDYLTYHFMISEDVLYYKIERTDNQENAD